MSSKCLSKSKNKNVCFKSSYRCRTCKKSFSYLAELKYHLRRHSIQRTESPRNSKTNSRATNNKNKNPHTSGFQCNVCQRSCRTIFYLKEHLESHSKETITKKTPLNENTSVEGVDELPSLSLECQISKNVFLDEPERGEHNITHAYDGLKCEICNLPFTTEISLRFHRKLFHRNDAADKPKENNISQLKCEICQAKFTFKGNLTKHKLVHTIGEDECEICHIKFTKKSLEMHEKEAHPELFEEDTVEDSSQENQLSDEITPPISSEIIPSSSSIDTIRPPISTEIITSAIAPMIPSIASDLNIPPIAPEIITPPIATDTITPPFTPEIITPITAKVTYICEQCGKSVSSVHHLHMHLKSHRRYSCEICGNLFTNKTGLSNHSRSHSFECYVCKEDFPSPERLVTHIRKHNVYEQWVDPANVYLSNWSPESSREILQNQPLVMVPRLNVKDTNVTYSAILDEPKDIEKRKVKDEPQNIDKTKFVNNIDIPPVVNGELPSEVDESEQGERISIELKYSQRFDNLPQIVDVKEKIDLLKCRDDHRASAFNDDGIIIVEQQPDVTTTFNGNANEEVIDISSESDIDEMELYHCYFCNETFRSLDVLGVHVKKCSFCP